jgi:TetR/AcrR family transcriptional regulator, cholesterol catabolism regulator
MSASPAAALTRRNAPGLARDNGHARERFDRRLDQILAHATAVFCDKGYDAASMRDLSRATGMSLAGLYYYFESKEKLLYLIQKHTFETILAGLRKRLEGITDPEQRIRLFVQNHLEYFIANQQAMKVLSHEDEVLKNGYGAEVRAIKRQYYRVCLGLVEDLMRARGVNYHPSTPKVGAPGTPESSGRIAVLSLFGMMNWIYTWYNPRVDADAEALAGQMSELFLTGLSGRTLRRRSRKQMTR